MLGLAYIVLSAPLIYHKHIYRNVSIFRKTLHLKKDQLYMYGINYRNLKNLYKKSQVDHHIIRLEQYKRPSDVRCDYCV